MRPREALKPQPECEQRRLLVTAGQSRFHCFSLMSPVTSANVLVHLYCLTNTQNVTGDVTQTLLVRYHFPTTIKYRTE